VTVGAMKWASHSFDAIAVDLPAFPAGAFQLRSAITGQALGTRTGEQFRHGIQIQLPAEHRVEIVEIRKQAR
jgi:hypothetical protein